MNAVQSSPTLSAVMLRTSFTFCSMLRHIHEGPVRAWPEANGTLLKEAPEAERCIPVDCVVGGFSGVFHPSRAFPAVSGDYGFLGLPFPFACGPGADGPFYAGFAHAYSHGVFFPSSSSGVGHHGRFCM